MSAQLALMEEDEVVSITCEHCGAVFVLRPESAKNFKEVHGCYIVEQPAENDEIERTFVVKLEEK